ncbi:MAG: chemotaxis protein CheA [Nitrospira sp.]|nr:chemotaxis protein CheA [Nitrospira sp.]
MATDLSQFQDAFFEESSEHLTTIEDGLLQLEQRPDDLDLLNRIFRAAHSIKGNSGMFGFTAVGQFTHKMETLLDQLRNGKFFVTPEITDILLRSTDQLKILIEAARGGAAPETDLLLQLERELAAAAEGGEVPESASSTPSQTSPAAPAAASTTPSLHRFRITWAAPAWLFQRGLDPVRMIGELEDLGTIVLRRLDTSRFPEFESLDPESCYLTWTLELETSKEQAVVEGVFDFVRDGGELTIEECDQGRVTRNEPDSSSVTRHQLPVTSEGCEPKPLGEILVESGVVSRETLDNALSQQKRLGEILVEQHVATPQQISQALQKQGDTATQAKKGGDAASIRVDTGKIDKLINLVGELVITQSMLSSLGTRFDMSQLPILVERVAQLERNTREIQERVMGIRMLPIGSTFSRFPRLVRDLSGKAGKKIQLLLSGEETELDKTVIESIGDPLTHLVRNSADHGLEPPEERLAAGKPELGTIRMNAFHEGGSICITVEDDGRGLNRDKILAKALKQGLIANGEKLSDDQINGLIFRPGFSTADKITDVSGRGVGMDVVKKNIEALGGTVSIKTALGNGTTFTLKLPLTLAIIEGMTVRVGRESYIIPLVSILESIQPTASSVKTITGKGEVVEVRGSYHPIVRLSEAFSIEADCQDPTKAILVMLETEQERVAVMVDELLGQQQVVIKSLEKNFRKVEGIAGATILGDGTVSFILDVRGLIELSRHGLSVAA